MDWVKEWHSAIQDSWFDNWERDPKKLLIAMFMPGSFGDRSKTFETYYSLTLERYTRNQVSKS